MKIRLNFKILIDEEVYDDIPPSAVVLNQAKIIWIVQSPKES